MIETQTKRTTQRKQHNRWLILIAVFKLVQALLFIALGVGALRLVHKDLGDALGDALDALARHLRFNPEGKLVSLLLEKASLVDDRMLRRIGAGSFLYAAVCMTEGIGLYLEKVWAEFFTLAITASFLPWEIYEIIRHATWHKVGLLAINMAVLLYLAKVIWEKRRGKRA